MAVLHDPAPVTAGQRRRVRDRISRRSRLIAVALTVALLVVMVDIFVQGPLTQLDIRIHRWDGEKEQPALDTWAWAYDKVGQRSVLVPILLVVAGVLARRHRTWRPVVLAAMSFLVLNVVVGAMKILIGRSETDTVRPERAQRRRHLPVRALVEHGAHRRRHRVPAAALRADRPGAPGGCGLGGAHRAHDPDAACTSAATG